ncbi:HTH domain-containing protein [Haloarcula amylovorans]|uniref:HTH domain-containing protein n=1 Tax=Haloarcula amylovorans TaxID=2562280 RepID=UPI001075D162|nr:HTH domain-containing protein [Halomicroarcula amylolytica]
MSSDETHDHLDELLPSSETDLRVEVFVHSLAPVGCKENQDTLVERLRALVADGALADIDLQVWGDSVATGGPLAEVGAGERIAAAISEFYELAAKKNISISPFFRISKVTSSVTDESFRRIVPPCCCIALYTEDGLVGVFPSLIDGVAYTPDDAITYLEARTSSELPSQILADDRS